MTTRARRASRRRRSGSQERGGSQEPATREDAIPRQGERRLLARREESRLLARGVDPLRQGADPILDDRLLPVLRDKHRDAEDGDRVRPLPLLRRGKDAGYVEHFDRALLAGRPLEDDQHHASSTSTGVTFRTFSSTPGSATSLASFTPCSFRFFIYSPPFFAARLRA